MEEQDEEKQDYLQVNIIDKGYDPDDFIDFLKVKKGRDDVDLDTWSLEELKVLVQEFYVYKTNGQIQPSNENTTQIQNDVKTDTNPLESIKTNTNPL